MRSRRWCCCCWPPPSMRSIGTSTITAPARSAEGPGHVPPPAWQSSPWARCRRAGMDGGERRLLGGTQLMGRWLEQRLPAELLGKFQIHLSSFAAADPDRIQIFWTHEHVSPADPELAHLADGGWRKFHRIVFVSNWQAQAYISYFGIPWSRCLVLHTAIEPLAVGGDGLDPLPPGRPL